MQKLSIISFQKKTIFPFEEFKNFNLFISLSGGGGEGPLSDKCRINSFTFLELAEAEDKVKDGSKDNLSVLSNNRDKQVLFQKIQEVDIDKSIKYITQDTDN